MNSHERTIYTNPSLELWKMLVSQFKSLKYSNNNQYASLIIGKVIEAVCDCHEGPELKCTKFIIFKESSHHDLRTDDLKHR